ncbi:hypothetical protein Bca52824_083397 [Brassica carinata]|uniref:Uncharacterized protein n=1 Tax=Brassica carinata TaxID=52824 RepID=A0A8X7TTT2_BRACI|nr:hypothetical protein Bca52824_083397 [Brassica carinata]
MIKLYVGYNGGLCLPGLCVRGSGGSTVTYGGGGGEIQYNGGVGLIETMYCKPLSCWSGSCDVHHLHLMHLRQKALRISPKQHRRKTTIDC